MKKEQYFNRMYFSYKFETISRIVIMVSQFLMIFVIFITSASLSKLITENSSIPESMGKVGIGVGVFRALTVMISVFGIIFSLGFIIPTLIIHDGALLKKMALAFLFIGVPFAGILFLASLITLIIVPVAHNVFGIILSIIVIALIVYSSLTLIKGITRHEEKIANAVKASEAIFAKSEKVGEDNA